MADYYCEHCGKKFEAPETIVQRCPSCFWTTSVHLVGEPARQIKENPNKSVKSPLPKLKLSSPPPKFIKIFIIVAFMFSVLWILKTVLSQNRGVLGNAKTNFQRKEPESGLQQKPATENSSSPKSAPVTLSNSDREILSREVKLEIPREFSADESEILNRQVDFPFQNGQFQKSKVWSPDEFEAFLAKQQKTKGIYFSWGYERKLVQLFKEHYLKSNEMLSKGDYEAARLELIQALVFPIYSNNIIHHKAVALVMLQPYINDVLSKIRQLNMYLLMERVKNLIQPVEARYKTVLSLITEKNIDQAFTLVESLENDIESINQAAKQTQIDYPPAVAQIDSDIRRGIDLQDEALEPVATGLNSIATDLRLKKKSLSQNLPGSLRATEQEYEKALSAIREQKWQEALLALEKIQFPSELADDARQKEAVIKKLTS